MYLEHIPACDLTRLGTWRNRQDYFIGTMNDSLRIWADIAGALDYIHAQGIEHNDIKPSNIIYSEARGAVLCDFGLSCTKGTVVSGGTPFYIPPDYLTKNIRGMPADIWGFGVTMLYVLRLTSLPDARGRPSSKKALYWQISEVHSQPKAGNELSAAEKMRMWLRELATIKGNLKEEEDPSYILRDMLELDPRRRVTANELVKRLDHERVSESLRLRRTSSRAGKNRAPKDSTLQVPRSPGDGSATEACVSTTQEESSGLD